MKFAKKIQKYIDIFRGKRPSLKSMFSVNQIIATSKQLKNIDLRIVGENNIVRISETARISGTLKISIYGDNNLIFIGNNALISQKLEIFCGQNHKNFGKVYDTVFKIGENTGIESLKYITYNSNSKCIIGEKCMFAFDITIYNTDAHPVFDVNTNEIINKVKEINIGNHCWIGARSTILKNTQIADDCIVGWGSVVAGKHLVPHCALAGNPAKKVKEGITWDANGSNGYVQNVLETSRGGGNREKGFIAWWFILSGAICKESKGAWLLYNNLRLFAR